MTVIAHRLIGHLQNGTGEGLLEKAALALGDHIPEKLLEELDSLMRAGSRNDAIALLTRIVAQNEHEKGLMKRLEMILFFHERRQGGSSIAGRRDSAIDRNEDSGFFSDADLSFLKNEAASLPGLDHEDISVNTQAGILIPAERNQSKELPDPDLPDSCPIQDQSLTPTPKQKKRSLQDEIDGPDKSQSPKRTVITTVTDTNQEQTVANGDEDHDVALSGPLEADWHTNNDAQDLDVLVDAFINEEVAETDDLLVADSYQIVDVDTLIGIQPGEVDHDFGDEYAAYAYDPDEIYDALEDQQTLVETRLSRDDRARQVAAELIARTGWTTAALPLLQQIFYSSGWGATRVSLEREINQGLTLDELILASHLKVIWSENENYWIAFDKNGNGLFSHCIISWPTALLVVRTFGAMPQIEELEVFVGSLYEHWIESPHLTRAFRSFSRYLWFRTARLEGCLPPDEPFNFESPHDLPGEEYSDLGYYDITGRQVELKLNEYGTDQIMAQRKDSLSFGAWCEYADQLDLETIDQVMNRDVSSSDGYEVADMEFGDPVESENDY